LEAVADVAFSDESNKIIKISLSRLAVGRII
jgi:hypothetical protein